MIKQPDTITKNEQDRLYARIPLHFCPGTPITKKQLFAGRKDQMTQVLGAVYHSGHHVIIFGDRGIGKTSLAAVLNEKAEGADSFILCRINCGADDTFDSLWEKMFTQITVPVEENGIETRRTITETLGETRITPFVVQQQLSAISHDKSIRVILIFDEFDTLQDRDARRLFAETIKTLSDFSIPSTIVLVGIADSVETLIEQHRSIERSLVQVRMPRMSPAELEEILITNGLDPLALGIEDSAKEWIIRLSQGLPNYVHLLGQNAAMIVAGELTRNITVPHVARAISKALEQTNHTIKNMYVMAVSCPRRNILREVLLACALAPTDALGCFAAGDIRPPLRKIMRDDTYDIPNFATHLNAFSTERGPVLVKSGTRKNYRYRFREPVLQPYVIMEGVSSGLLPGDYFTTP